MGISRRAVIIGSSVMGAAVGVGGWGLLADARVVPGRGLIDQALGRCDIEAPPPEAAPGRLLRSSFYSKKRARSINYMLAYPPKVAAGASLPVCLVLHGLGDDEHTAFDGLGYHRILAALVGAKVPPFVLASINGGSGYWHPRPGDDPLGMLLTEFPAVLAQHGLATTRFGLLGWSMGGFGALLAATESPDRFPVVVADSPAFWSTYHEAHTVNPEAFSSDDEWTTYGELTRLRLDKLRHLQVRIDCGESDPFYPAVDDLRDLLPDGSVVHTAPGCHDTTFWRSVAADQLRLVGTTLTPPKKT